MLDVGWVKRTSKIGEPCRNAHARLARRAISLPVWNRQSGFLVIIPIGFDWICTYSYIECERLEGRQVQPQVQNGAIDKQGESKEKLSDQLWGLARDGLTMDRPLLKVKFSC